jgi:hypothetical protein
MKINMIFAILVIISSLLMVSNVSAGGQTWRYVDNVQFENPQWVETGFDATGKQYWTVVGPANRRTSGDGGTIGFEAGEIVQGVDIVVNGQEANNCILNPAPGNGTVKTGVVNPWLSEVKRDNKPYCFGTTPAAQPFVAPPPPAQPAPAIFIDGQRQVTGVGGILRFGPGMRVAGFAIRYDSGRTVQQCYEGNTPEGGLIQDGVIYPWLAEASVLPNCPR